MLGALTCVVLIAWLTRIPIERRAQAIGVVLFATIGEITGSLIWGVYTYRLHNLPLFVPPAHGIVFLTGLSLALALARHPRAVVGRRRGRASPGASSGLPGSRGSTSPARSASRCS